MLTNIQNLIEMIKHLFYFQGIGSYDPKTGKAIYNVITPKIPGLVFHFDTEDVRKIIWEDKECLMIFTSNGKDDDKYGTTPEIIKIEFTIPDVEKFHSDIITLIINHDTDKQGYTQRTVPSSTGKPRKIGIGSLVP